MPKQKAKSHLDVEDYFNICQLSREGKSQREIGKIYSITQERVSQILQKKEYTELTEDDVRAYKESEGQGNKDDARVREMMDLMYEATKLRVKEKLAGGVALEEDEFAMLKDGTNTLLKGQQVKKGRDFRKLGGEDDGNAYLITVRDELVRVAGMLCPECRKKIAEYEAIRAGGEVIAKSDEQSTDSTVKEVSS